MENSVETAVDQAFDAIVAAPVAAAVEAPAAPEAPKVDRRKGERKVKNADGSVSYGFKADGTPRAKPGRRPKAANAA